MFQIVATQQVYNLNSNLITDYGTVHTLHRNMLNVSGTRSVHMLSATGSNIAPAFPDQR
jgi:hypothetical protein